MITGGVCQLVLTLVGLAATLGGGVADGPLCCCWQGRCCGVLVLGCLAGRSLVGRLGGGMRGLQLLATTVYSSSSSSARM